MLLDAPDVALRGKGLLVYGERPRREEAEIIQEPGWAILQTDNINPRWIARP